jgi:cytochrome c biogenesis protein CcmG/thiol:disulfide interchange protein DsbE
MTLDLRAKLKHEPRCRLAGYGRLLAGGLLVAAVWSSAGADQLVITALLKPLDLVGYRSSTTPPHFSGHTFDGRRLSLADLRGQVVVVNFWASWCAECRPEMPMLQGLHLEFASRGLAIIGINAREDTQAVGRYATELRLTFPLVLDPGGTNHDRYGVIGIPTTFVVGRDGRAVAFGVGPRDWGSPAAHALIETLLAEPARRVP